MTTRLEPLDGLWLELRDNEEVTNRQRRPFMRVVQRMRNGEKMEEDEAFMLAWGASVSFMLLAAWSRAEPIPAKFDEFVEMLDDVPASVYDAVTVACIEEFNKATAVEDDGVPQEPATEGPPVPPVMPAQL